MTHVALHDQCVTNAVVKEIAETYGERLVSIDLSANPNVSEVWPLGVCVHLRYVDLSDTGVEFCPKTFANCVELEYLDLSRTLVHPDTIELLRERCPKLTLVLEGCPNLRREPTLPRVGHLKL